LNEIHDDTLGTLTFNAEWDEFNGNVPFGDKRVKISIYFSLSPEGISEEEKIQARTLYLILVSRKEALEAEIVAKYLPVYNEGWREDSEPINQEQFMNEVKPDQIAIYPKVGQGSIFYDTGYLFSYHHINVHFNIDGNISRMTL
jgi:hypothetical protein